MSIKTTLEQRGISSEQLDDLVHEAAGRLASNANNDGMSSQLDFLMVVCGWDEETILAELEDESAA